MLDSEVPVPVLQRVDVLEVVPELWEGLDPSPFELSGLLDSDTYSIRHPSEEHQLFSTKTSRESKVRNFARLSGHLHIRVLLVGHAPLVGPAQQLGRNHHVWVIPSVQDFSQ